MESSLQFDLACTSVAASLSHTGSPRSECCRQAPQPQSQQQHRLRSYQKWLQFLALRQQLLRQLRFRPPDNVLLGPSKLLFLADRDRERERESFKEREFQRERVSKRESFKEREREREREKEFQKKKERDFQKKKREREEEKKRERERERKKKREKERE